MKNIELILQELVDVNLPPIEAQQVQHIIQHAFMAGKAEQADPLEGYSNLTEAIESDAPIVWERLDGLASKCVHPELGTLRGKLERDSECPVNHMDGWWGLDMDASYFNAFVKAWHGKDGWTLWLEGEIPMRRKTADQLEVGHFFTGKLSDKSTEELMCVVGDPGNGKHVRYASNFMPSQHPASKWEVIEEHGTFQKPEGK